MHTTYIHPQIRSSQLLFSDLLATRLATTLLEHLTAFADRLHSAHQAGNDAVVAHLSSWCPERISLSASDQLALPLSVSEARASTAREHGYRDWMEVGNESAGKRFDPLFEKAVDCVVTGEADMLRALLTQRPELATEHSPFGHGATLLHYVGANGVETWRQTAPSNGAEIASILLERGADPAASAGMYGGSTALELVETSAHPAAAGTTEAIAAVLREALEGAADAPGSDAP
ncbi:MAG: hypothetical protein DWQ30_21065 [Acidobacteria bacterium]|nr:MAG: hypothetical protein DWQ30_21065 [Acidobacteriota bacterium]